MYEFIRLKHVVVVDFFAFTMQILLCSNQRKEISKNREECDKDALLKNKARIFWLM